MKTYNTSYVKTHLSQILDEVKLGKEIVICHYKQPIARLIPIENTKRSRKFGALKEIYQFDDSFFDKPIEDELSSWG